MPCNRPPDLEDPASLGAICHRSAPAGCSHAMKMRSPPWSRPPFPGASNRKAWLRESGAANRFSGIIRCSPPAYPDITLWNAGQDGGGASDNRV